MATNVYRYHVPTAFQHPDPECQKAIALRNNCRYELITNNAVHVHTKQKMCVYVGLEGPDTGLYFVASLSDFAMKFIPDVEPPTVPTQDSLPVTGGAVPEKVAGHKSTSLGA